MLSMPRIVRPDPHRIRGTESGSPAGPATRRSIKRNKELPKSSDWKMRQSNEPSRPAHLKRFIGDEAIPDSRLGLDETWTCRITFNLLAKVGDINAEILSVLFRFRASDFALSFFRSSHS